MRGAAVNGLVAGFGLLVQTTLFHALPFGFHPSPDVLVVVCVFLGLHRQVSRLLALEDTVDIAGGAPERRNEIGAVSDQCAAVGEIRERIHGGQSVVGGNLNDQIAMN
jgi:hypothetical protein